jgi:acyl-CoA thioesterase-1
MNRSLHPLLVVLAIVACSAADSPEAARDTGAPGRSGAADVVASDSTMVVPTEARVPSDEPPVVVFLGTSLTAGMGLEREADGYVSVLAQMADSASRPFRAVNAGVSGDTSAGGLRRVDWLLRSQVDVLVVELGANDGLRGQDPEALAANLEEIIRRTREAYPEALFVLAGMEAPPNMGDRYTAAFRAVFPEVARSTGAALIPFLLEGVAGVPELNQDDRIHPNPEGHRRVALNAWPVLEAVMGEVMDRRVRR